MPAIITNPSFELLPALTGWTTTGTNEHSPLADAPSGAYTLRQVITGGVVPTCLQNLPAVPGERYIVTAKYRVSAGATARLRVDTLNASGVQIATVLTVNGTNSLSTFAELRGVFTVPAGAATAFRVVLSMLPGADGLAARWDDVHLEPVAAGVAVWSGGYGWEPSGQSAPTLWQGVDAGVGWPDIIVDGILVTDRCLGASWSSGRSWWLAGPEPGSATVELQGTLAGELAGAVVGDILRIDAEPVGVLWRGWIDAIAETTVPQDGELAQGLTIQASDAMSRLLSVELYNSLALVAGTLDRRLADLADAAGVPGPQVVTVLPTSAALPVLAAVTLAGSTANPLRLGAHLEDCEKASNAITATARDGSWIVLPRARVTTTPHVVTLDGTSDLNELHRAVATPERVRNVFTIAGTPTTIPTSVAKYGRRGYDVPAGIASTPPPYAPETLAALAEPLPFANGTVPVRSRTADAVALQLFDWCRVSTRPDDELYQLLAMSWRADPGDWSLTVELDRTQVSIAAPSPPDVVDPPNPIPPTTAIVTDTWTSDKSAYVVRTTGGLNAGNGASVDLLVGLLGDGNKSRGLIRVPLSWRGKVVRVLSAKLLLEGGQTTCSAYGSGPTFVVRRVTESWSEGTFATRCAFSGSNAVVWPGPSATDSGKVTKAGPKSSGARVEIDITAIVAAWASGSSNYGVQLRGGDETSSSDRAPVWSDDAASGDRPQIRVQYEYEV